MVEDGLSENELRKVKSVRSATSTTNLQHSSKRGRRETSMFKILAVDTEFCLAVSLPVNEYISRRLASSNYGCESDRKNLLQLGLYCTIKAPTYVP
jgi:hypothetical protein